MQGGKHGSTNYNKNYETFRHFKFATRNIHHSVKICILYRSHWTQDQPNRSKHKTATKIYVIYVYVCKNTFSFWASIFSHKKIEDGYLKIPIVYLTYFNKILNGRLRPPGGGQKVFRPPPLVRVPDPIFFEKFEPPPLCVRLCLLSFEDQLQ